MGKYFGTDGIRGVAGKDLTVMMAYKIGQSLKKTFNTEKVVVGQDTRESSDLLALAVANGAMSTGVDVLYVSVAPTPVIAHYSKTEGITGIMVTASHNPYQDNGIKIFDKGYKMKTNEEMQIEAHIDGETLTETGGAFGRFVLSDEPIERYMALYDQTDFSEINLSVCLDTANGATSGLAERLLKDYVDDTVIIHNTPDGRNINENCGSTHMDALKESITERKCDLGFAFDGDGDRVLAADHTGKIVDGDLLIYLLAVHMKDKDRLNKNTVVLTKMSNPGIVKAFKDAGIKVVQTDVGDKHVAAELFKHGYLIGGENSGHIIIADRLHTGDGILAASEVLRVLQDTRRTIPSLLEPVEIYPYILENVKDVDKRVVEEKAVKTAVKDAKKELGNDALVLLRASGTEPLVRITVSHKDEEKVQKTVKNLKDLIIEHGRDKND